MKIIRPLGNRISTKVKSWSEIKYQAQELREFLKMKDFDGYWEDAYAISHVQVSLEPKQFFVLNKNMEKTFGSWCVVNLKILSKEEECIFPEGCMSFPFRKTKRVNRYAKIKVRYWVPFLNRFLIPKWKTFKYLPAFICQHEVDHAHGINIYAL